MIVGFESAAIDDIFIGRKTKQARKILPQELHAKAQSKLVVLDAATTIESLRIPPSNNLKVLHGDRNGQYSIRINDQYRICFTWDNGNADNVEIVDYH